MTAAAQVTAEETIREVRHDLTMLGCHLRGMEQLIQRVVGAGICDGTRPEIDGSLTGLDGGITLARSEAERLGERLDNVLD